MLYSRSSIRPMIAIAASTFLISACGGPSEERVPVYKVSGKVSYEGKPLPGAFVLFRKAEAEPKVPSPTATTGEDGSFTLHTYEPEDGAPAGEYLVSVSTSPTGGGGVKLLSGQKKANEDVLKGRYADPKTSGLKATVKSAETTLDPFNLTATGGTAPVVNTRPNDR